MCKEGGNPKEYCQYQSKIQDKEQTKPLSALCLWFQMCYLPLGDSAGFLWCNLFTTTWVWVPSHHSGVRGRRKHRKESDSPLSELSQTCTLRSSFKTRVAKTHIHQRGMHPGTIEMGIGFRCWNILGWQHIPQQGRIPAKVSCRRGDLNMRRHKKIKWFNLTR